MVFGSLFIHRDSAARKLWRGDREPQQQFQGFPLRTFLLIPPPVVCSIWWCSYRFQVDVPTPDGWGRIGEDDGIVCGWYAVGGWMVLVLAIWWDGYVAFKLGIGSQRVAGEESGPGPNSGLGLSADADANMVGAKQRTPDSDGKRRNVRNKKNQ